MFATKCRARRTPSTLKLGGAGGLVMPMTHPVMKWWCKHVLKLWQSFFHQPLVHKQKPVKQATTMTTENSSTAAAATNDDADQPTERPTDRASDRPTDHGRRRRRLGPSAWCGGAAPTLVAMSSGSRGDGTPFCSCGKHRLTPLKTASLRAAWAQEEGVKWATRSTWFHA